jgi:hypothetical protein
LPYIDKKSEAVKANEERGLKEEAKKKALLRDKSKYWGCILRSDQELTAES